MASSTDIFILLRFVSSTIKLGPVDLSSTSMSPLGRCPPSVLVVPWPLLADCIGIALVTSLQTPVASLWRRVSTVVASCWIWIYVSTCRVRNSLPPLRSQAWCCCAQSRTGCAIGAVPVLLRFWLVGALKGLVSRRLGDRLAGLYSTCIPGI